MNLGTSDPTNVAANEPEPMIEVIHQQQLIVGLVVNETTDVVLRRQALQALAALQTLRELYEEKLAKEKLEEEIAAAQSTEAIVAQGEERTTTISSASEEREESLEE